MTSVSFLYTQSDRSKAEQLKDHLQAKLGTGVDVKSIEEMKAEHLDVKDELTSSNCVVLIGSCQASSLIQKKKQEIVDGFLLFDGLISEIFTAEHGKLVIVFFSEEDKNDWIPPGFNSNKIFRLSDDEIQHGGATWDHFEDCIRGILGEKKSDKDTFDSKDI